MQSKLIENRQIRIFISSTFKDMAAERDHLITKVFPALRRYCAERDVTLFELDLRWGISEEESKQGKVVDICLKEIRNTAPFFIGLLGERYGWVPNDEERRTIGDNTPVFEEYPWVKDELANGTSITEIEIQEGVLRAEERVNAYFYFRSPKMETAVEFREEPGSREAEKLSGLKDTLRGQEEYPVEEYDSVEHLGQLVEADFKELADRLFPQGALSALEKERLEQRTFLKSRTGVYVANPGWNEALDRFAVGEERALVVSGGSGMGKSALLANWVAGRQAASAFLPGGEPKPGNGEKIIYHFIGQSGAEGDYRKITGRLIGEARDLYGLPAEEGEGLSSPGGEGASKDNKQTETLQNLLFSTVGRGRLVIVLDGMDGLFDIDNAKLLNWLPAFPENVKVIYSAAQGDPVMEVFKRREYRVLELEALPLESREQLVVDYLKAFGKGLLPAQIERIAADRENENPPDPAIPAGRAAGLRRPRGTRPGDRPLSCRAGYRKLFCAGTGTAGTGVRFRRFRRGKRGRPGRGHPVPYRRFPRRPFRGGDSETVGRPAAPLVPAFQRPGRPRQRAERAGLFFPRLYAGRGTTALFFPNRRGGRVSKTDCRVHGNGKRCFGSQEIRRAAVPVIRAKGMGQALRFSA
jgi:hypothetical protein